MSATRRWQMLFVQSLTIGRIPLIFIFLGVSVFAPHPPSAMWFSIAFGAMILSAVTDLFDGYLARKFKVETQLGAYADPLTDKVFYLTTFPTLVFLAARENEIGHAQLLLGLTILFLLRDQWVSFLRSIGALYQVDAKANWSGKARTVISFPVICAFYYVIQAPQHWRLQVPDVVIYILIIASMGINLISMWVYTVNYWPWLKKELSAPVGPPDDDQGDGE
jgi:CDP-diacylglycerol--glycerol-3-phosphate 3-phosphatidyltransferase